MYVIFVPCLINPILSLSDSRLLNPELRQNWQCKVLLIYFFVIYLNMLVRIYGGMVFVTEFTSSILFTSVFKCQFELERSSSV